MEEAEVQRTNEEVEPGANETRTSVMDPCTEVSMSIASL